MRKKEINNKILILDKENLIQLKDLKKIKNRDLFKPKGLSLDRKHNLEMFSDKSKARNKTTRFKLLN
jgi:hypothetical protein